jgi:hypothetical protein
MQVYDAGADMYILMFCNCGFEVTTLPEHCLLYAFLRALVDFRRIKVEFQVTAILS